MLSAPVIGSKGPTAPIRQLAGAVTIELLMATAPSRSSSRADAGAGRGVLQDEVGNAVDVEIGLIEEAAGRGAGTGPDRSGSGIPAPNGRKVTRRIWMPTSQVTPKKRLSVGSFGSLGARSEYWLVIASVPAITVRVIVEPIGSPPVHAKPATCDRRVEGELDDAEVVRLKHVPARRNSDAGNDRGAGRRVEGVARDGHHASGKHFDFKAGPCRNRSTGCRRSTGTATGR